ncbi:MAG: MmgE/PrpD family protein [Candidatus Aenigmarchaeota archaeon]|nr:MmgE/PrpD family protein [Candidatus Aenigmarchaeota archaeon]
MDEDAGVTEQFAKFIVNTKSSKIPDAATDAAATGILDCVGTALAASTRRIGKIIIRHIDQNGGEPVARVIGTGIRTSAPNAALANGTLGHADDYDDVCDFGHSSAVLMPTLLALGEQLHKSGKNILDAYVLGFEIGARINTGIGTNHYFRGWHSTSTIGTIAAAAAASRLLGLNVAQTRMALGIAASHAGGVQANFGTMAKPLHPGNAARSGIVAAQLAGLGYTASPDAIEAPLGYAAVFGNRKTNVRGMVEKLGEAPYRILVTGIRIKQWPCCYGNHAAIFLAIELASKFGIRPEQVKGMEFFGAEATNYLNRPDVHTDFDSKFSLQFNIAAAIVDDRITHGTFSGKKITDPKIRSMMGKIILRKSSWKNKILFRGNPSDPAQTLVVHLKDGRSVSGTAKAGAGALLGRRVYEKFISNARLAIPVNRAKNALEILRDLKNLRGVTELMDAVTAN